MWRSPAVVVAAVLVNILVRASSGLEIKRIPVVSVTGVEGGSVALPCEVSHPSEDAIYLLLWFREPLTTPIYRLDERSEEKESHWSDEEQLGSRAVLEVRSSSAVLRISTLTRADQGLYTCRVDFRLQPTTTTRVNLTVVVPPQDVRVVLGDQDTPGTMAGSVVGPYREGAVLKLTCVAYGGTPRPSVVWLKGNRILDDDMESEPPEESNQIFNELSHTTLSPGYPTPLPPYEEEAYNTLYLGPPTLLTAFKGEMYNMLAFSHQKAAPVFRKGPYSLLKARRAKPRRVFRGNPYNTLSVGSSAPPPAFGGEPYNTLTLGPLQRSDLLVVLTCQASNTNLTLPTDTTLTMDMNLPPLSVDIIPPSEANLRAGREYVVECVVVGARPSPTVTWWIDHLQLLQAEVTTSADGNVTTSTVFFSPRAEYHGSVLRCVAESYAAPAILEDSYNLTVYYVPMATCSFGSSLDAGNIKEGDDVYFECTIQSNPRVTRVSWRHNDVVLVHNVSGGVIISNQSLVLQRVVRAQAGRYSCHAHNLVGDGASNSLRLDVKYAPVCSPGQVTTYAVGRYEDAEVTCSVDANPVQDSFQWTFNNTADTIDVPQGRFTSTQSHSVITYTPMTSLDYGTLLCWATNAIGSQRDPCVFHIVPAGKPESPSNCTVGQGSGTSVRVKCAAGASGGLPQHFHLQARLHQGQHAFNLTSPTLPVFQVEGLQVAGKYQLSVSAVNAKGSSEPVLLTVTSLATNGSVYQLYDGPSEAEVRDGGKINTSDTKTEEHPGNTFLDTLTLPSVIMVVLGVGSGLVLLVILLLLFITFRSRRAPQLLSLAAGVHSHKEMDDPHSRAATARSPRSSRTSSTLTPEHDSSCLERDMQQVEIESDVDPDIIPLQECRGGGEEEQEVVPPATLLPPDAYKYPAYVTAPHQSHPRYSIPGVPLAVPTPPTPPGGLENFPGRYYPREYLQHDPTYLQETSATSTLPRRASITPPNTSASYSTMMNPHHLACRDVEGSLPPPAGFLGPDRKRVSFARHLSCEDDAPSTPLLKKGESCV